MQHATVLTEAADACEGKVPSTVVAALIVGGKLKAMLACYSSYTTPRRLTTVKPDLLRMLN